jgi:hypothetical protein
MFGVCGGEFLVLCVFAGPKGSAVQHMVAAEAGDTVT